MKAHFLKSLANVVSNYPENSANFSTLTIIFTHLQLIASFFIGYQKLPSELISTNVLVKVLRSFTFQIIAEDLTYVAQVLFFFITALSSVFIIMTFMIKCINITRHWWYWIPIISPMMVGIGARIIVMYETTNNQSTGIRIANICCVIYFIILWTIRRVFFIQTFGQANMSIHRQIYLWNVLVTFGNYIIFQFTGNIQIISIFSFVMTSLIIIINIFRFSYIYPELEYMSFTWKFVCLAFSGSHILFYYLELEILYSLIILLTLVLFLEKVDVFKSLLSLKYIMLCKKSLKQQISDQSSIVLVILICRKKAIDFKLGYEDYLQMAYIEILHKIGVNNFKQYSSLNRDYLFTFLQNKYLHSKEQDLNIFLAYWFLHYKMFIKAVKYMTYLTEQKDSFFVMLNSAILTQKNKIFLKNCRSLNVKQQQPASHSLCRMDPNAVKQIDPQQMFIREKKLQDFTSMISQTFEIQSNLIKKLLSSELYGNQIEDLMRKIWQKKDKIIQFMDKNKNQFEHKQFIIIKYLFWTLCCHKKFMVFEMLQKLFLPYLTIDKNLIKDDFLAVIVSGQNDSIGIIMLANKPMRQFFSLSTDKIRSRSENIDQIIPRSIAQQHNNMLYSFKQRGTSKFIGIPQNFYVVRQGQIFRVDAYIKIYQHMDGLMFAGRLKLVDNHQKFILYDSQGFIQTCSKQFDFKLNKGQAINIYDIIDNSGDIDISSKNSAVLKYQSQIRSRRHGSEASKNTIRKRFSDSKLRGAMMLIVGDKKVKATFDYFCGEKYFQGICTVTKLNQIDQQIEQHQRMIMSTFNSQANKKLHKSHKTPIVYDDTDKTFLDMQYRIWKNNKCNCVIILFIFAVCLYFAGGSFVVFTTNPLFSQHTQQLKIVSTIQKNLKSQVSRIFQIGVLLDVLYSYHTGNISQDSGVPFNHSSVSEYLNKVFQHIIKDLNRDYNLVMQNLKKLPLQFNILLMQEQKFPTTQFYNYSFHQFQGLIQLTFKQMANYNNVQFLANWQSSSSLINYYYNYFSLVVKDTIFPKLDELSNKLATQQLVQQNTLTYTCLVLIFAILISTAFIYYFLIRKVRNNIQLVTHVSNKQLSIELDSIQRGLYIIQQLSKYQVNNFTINNKYKTVSFDLKNQIFNFKSQQINKTNFWQGQSQNTGAKKRKSIKFSSRATKYAFNWILLGSIIIVVIYYYASLFDTSYSITDQTIFFQRYLNDINQVTTSLSGLLLLNIDTFIYGQTSPFYLGMPYTQALQYYKDTIFKRKYVDQLIKNFNWKDVKDMLYNNQCKQGQSVCQNLLSSSFTIGMNSASIAFALDNLLLWNRKDSIISQQINNKLLSVFFSYFDYLKPQIMQIIDQSQNLFFAGVDNDMTVFAAVSQIILIPMVLSFVIGIICNLYIINRQINSMYRQILTIYSVDIITKHMQFAYEINKLQ